MEAHRSGRAEVDADDHRAVRRAQDKDARSKRILAGGRAHHVRIGQAASGTLDQSPIGDLPTGLLAWHSRTQRALAGQRPLAFREGGLDGRTARIWTEWCSCCPPCPPQRSYFRETRIRDPETTPAIFKNQRFVARGRGGREAPLSPPGRQPECSRRQGSADGAARCAQPPSYA